MKPEFALKRLSDKELDAFKELCNIGMGHATSAFAKLISCRVDLTVPSVRVVSLADVPELIGNVAEPVVGIYIQFSGEIRGDLLLIFPKESAFALQSLLFQEKRQELVFDELQISMLKEIGNILAGSYLGVMEHLLGMSLIPSVPWFAFDLLGAILDPILIKLAETEDETLLIEAEFFARGKEEIAGKFFMIPDPGSVGLTLEAMGL